MFSKLFFSPRKDKTMRGKQMKTFGSLWTKQIGFI